MHKLKFVILLLISFNQAAFASQARDPKLFDRARAHQLLDDMLDSQPPFGPGSLSKGADQLLMAAQKEAHDLDDQGSVRKQSWLACLCCFSSRCARVHVKKA